MAPKRKHHYIPKVYLDGFVDPHTPPGHAPFIWVRDMASGNVRRRAPKNVAAETGYYAVQRDGVVNYDSVENELAAVENRAAVALRLYLAATPGSRGAIPVALGDFLALLAARVPWLRRAANEQWRLFLDESATQEDINLDADFPVCLSHRASGEEIRMPLRSAVDMVRSGEWDPSFDQVHVIELMQLQAWYFRTEHFPRLYWILLTAPGGKTFITSDRPVVWFVPGRGYADSPGALKDPDVQLSVPLDSRRALLALGRRPASLDFRVAPEDVNRRTAHFAERFIIGADRTFGGTVAQ